MLVPSMTEAKASQIYTFGRDRTSARWESIGPISFEDAPDGVRLMTGTATGGFFTIDTPPFRADAGEMTYSIQGQANLHFAWVFKNDVTSTTNAIKLDTERGEGRSTTFTLGHARQWRQEEMQMGLILGPHSDIIIHDLTLIRWNLLEKSVAILQSFWQHYTFNPLVVNFVWGPQFEWIPSAVPHIFDHNPPVTTSATFVINCILFALFIIAAFLAFLEGKSIRNMHPIVMKCVIGSWIALMLSMDLQFLSWVRDDIREYIHAPYETRTFRDRGEFYDFAAFAQTFIGDRKSYIFLAERDWPYLGNMRYLTYPHIPGNAFTTDDLWVIYHRPDIRLNDHNQLVSDDVVLTLPGKVLGIFDESSFIFQTPPIQ